MTKKEEMVLKATKEIVVKFIEVGRIFPSSFEENYQTVFRTIWDSIPDGEPTEEN